MLADDIVAIDISTDDQTQDVVRCIRLGSARVDCIFEIGFDGPEWAQVRAVKIVGKRLYSDSYAAKLRRRYTKANAIRVSPRGFRLRPLQHDYRRLRYRYRPESLLKRDVGWGRPHLPGLIRAQCSLQPRLRC